MKDLKQAKLVYKKTKNIGQIAVIKPVLDAIAFKEKVKKYSPKERDRDLTHGEALEILVLNRLSAPKPLYKVEEWASSLPLEKLYQVNLEKLNDDRFGRALDAVHPYIRDIEPELATDIITSLGVSTDLIHFDITSFYFEGEYEKEELITFGYSRDNHPDKKQVNLGLDVSGEGGFPLQHQLYPGNTSDSKTVAENMSRLKKTLKSEHLIIVGDRKMVTPENIAAYEENKLEYIATLQLTNQHKRMIQNIPEEEFSKLDYNRGKGSYYGVEKKIVIFHKHKPYFARALIVLSEEKLKRDIRSREKGIKEITRVLEHIRSKLNQRRYKDKSYVKQRIKELTKGKKAKKFFNIKLNGKDGELSLEYFLNEKLIEEEKKLEGKYIIITNVEGYSSSQTLQAYKSRFIVERRIRDMKSDIKVRPVFLQNEERVEALVFITIVALMIYSVLEFLCHKAGLNITSRTLLSWFSKLILINVVFADGTILNVVEDLDPIQEAVLRKLNFPAPDVIFS